MNKAVSVALPRKSGLFFDGAWNTAHGGTTTTLNPGTGEVLADVAEATADDVNDAVASAHRAFKAWSRVKPLERAALLKRVAAVLRDHAEELALLDAANCGNPVKAMIRDVHDGPDYIDFFAGLATEAKGDVTPMGEDVMNLTLQEPYGVCARIVAYNHPYMFAAMKIGAPLGRQHRDHQAPTAGTPVRVPDVRDHRRDPAAWGAESAQWWAPVRRGDEFARADAGGHAGRQRTERTRGSARGSRAPQARGA